MTALRQTLILGVTLTRTAEKAPGSEYYLWRCGRCGRKVNGSGLSTYSHVRSKACREGRGGASRGTSS